MSNQRENSWRAGCNESCTSGSEGEFRKSTPRCKVYSHILDEAHLDSTLHMPNKLDLNSYLIKHPAATFFVRVTGDSMKGAHIQENDLLIVDRSINAGNNKVVIALVNNEFTVKRLKYMNKQAYLVPENDDYQPIKVDENCYIWGVVTSVIHQF